MPPVDPEARLAPRGAGTRGGAGRVRGLLWILLGLALGMFGGANSGLAFIFPLEIEFREGTSWLHVLAMQAGVSLYDHTRVAFLNTLPGPLDPLLKYGIHSALPFLPAAMVTRFFVLLLPLGLFAAMFRARDRRWREAVIWSGALYLFLLGLQPYHFLIGRPDPPGILFIALMLVAGDIAVAASRENPMRRSLWAGLTGVLAAAVFLTCWRYSPVPLGCAFAWALDSALAAKGTWRQKTLTFLGFGGCFAAGVLALFLPIFVGVFHGDYFLYFSHFFGIFFDDGGWGFSTHASFSLFPLEVFATGWALHGLLVALFFLSLIFPAPRISRQGQLWGWVPVLAALWLVFCLELSMNRDAGGRYYLAPFYVVLAFYLARALDWTRMGRPLVQIALLAVLDRRNALEASLPASGGLTGCTGTGADLSHRVSPFDGQ